MNKQLASDTFLDKDGQWKGFNAHGQTVPVDLKGYYTPKADEHLYEMVNATDVRTFVDRHNKVRKTGLNDKNKRVFLTNREQYRRLKVPEAAKRRTKAMSAKQAEGKIVGRAVDGSNVVFRDGAFFAGDKPVATSKSKFR